MAIKELLKQSENKKKRTALYLDQDLFDDLQSFAVENKVSINKAAIYLLNRSLDSLDAE